MNSQELSPSAFQEKILQWFAQHGRKDLPWQIETTPYRVWVSEIMLQQTQVATVIPYFNRFIAQFPDVTSLAHSSLDRVLEYWAGLGYYARARNLHQAAQIIESQGFFPTSLDSLMQLPGIGQSTAGAIMSIAYHQSHAILDGNVKRVLARFNAVEGWPGHSMVSRELWSISKRFTPVDRVAADYTQAIMDLGATVCTRSNPLCRQCPVSGSCRAKRENRIKEFPASRPSSVLPVKNTVFLLLIRTDDAIMLEKRPETGIWGGLWSLPEFSTSAQALAWCGEQNLCIAKRQLLPTLGHTFSHFHLKYTPLIVRTDYPINNVMEVNQTVWYKSDQNTGYGLPAPVKRLLETIDLNLKTAVDR